MAPGTRGHHSFIPDGSRMRWVPSWSTFHSEGNGGPQRWPETVHIDRAHVLGGALCCTYMNSPVLTGIPWGRYCPRVLGYYYHPHFTDKEKEARELTHPTQRRPDGTWWSQASHPVLSKPSASGPGSGGWSIWGWNSDPAGTHPAVLPYRKFGLHHGYPAHRGLEELFASSAPLLAHVMGEGQWGPKEVQPRVKGELRQRSACCILTC